MNKELKKELEEIAPMLSNLPKNDLKAPEGYFSSFSDRMLDRIKAEESQPSKSLVFPITNFTKYLAAAVVLFFMGLSIYIFKINNEVKMNSTTEQAMSTEDIYLSEIDEATLVEFTANDNIKIDVKSNIDEYQEYIDEETIIEEL